MRSGQVIEPIGCLMRDDDPASTLMRGFFDKLAVKAYDLEDSEVVGQE